MIIRILIGILNKSKYPIYKLKYYNNQYKIKINDNL